MSEINYSKLAFEITYAYPTAKYLSSFVKTTEYIMDAICDDSSIGLEILANKKGGIQKVTNMLEKKWINGRKITDAMASSDKALSDTAKEIISGIVPEDLPHKLKVIFHWLPCPMCDVYQYAARGYSSSIANMTITDNPAFMLRNSFNSYSGESYGLALKFDQYWIAFECCDAGLGSKGAYSLKITEATPTDIVIDNADKYLDVTPFIEGMH